MHAATFACRRMEVEPVNNKICQMIADGKRCVCRFGQNTIRGQLAGARSMIYDHC